MRCDGCFGIGIGKFLILLGFFEIFILLFELYLVNVFEVNVRKDIREGLF